MFLSFRKPAVWLQCSLLKKSFWIFFHSFLNSQSKMNNQKCPIRRCPFPAKSYDSAGLVRHLKSFHSSTRFGCYLCDRSFSDLNILYLHLKHHGALPEKNKIKLFETSTTGYSVIIRSIWRSFAQPHQPQWTVWKS